MFFVESDRSRHTSSNASGHRMEAAASLAWQAQSILPPSTVIKKPFGLSSSSMPFSRYSARVTWSLLCPGPGYRHSGIVIDGRLHGDHLARPWLERFGTAAPIATVSPFFFASSMAFGLLDPSCRPVPSTGRWPKSCRPEIAGFD